MPEKQHFKGNFFIICNIIPNQVSVESKITFHHNIVIFIHSPYFRVSKCGSPPIFVLIIDSMKSIYSCFVKTGL